MNNRTRLFGTRSLTLCAIALAVVLGFSLAACGNGTTGTATGTEDEPLVYQDVVAGKVVEITISRTELSRAVLTPRTGDYYVIKYDSVVISKGRITITSGGQTTFKPSADSPGPKTDFSGTFGEGSLSLPSIPMDDGNLSGVDATPDGGTTPGNTGGGGGGGSGGGGGGSGGGGTGNGGGGTTNPPPAATAKTLTLTGIPSTYEGKYAYFETRDSAGNVVVTGRAEPAIQGSIQARAVGNISLPQIIGGKVEIPLWDSSGAKYTGSGSFSTDVDPAKSGAFFKVFDTPTIPDTSLEGLITDVFDAINIVSEVVEKIWNELRYYDHQVIKTAGTYVEGTLSLPYSASQAGLEKDDDDYTGALIYPETHYLLTEDFTTAKQKLVDSFGEPRPQDIHSGEDITDASLRIGSSIFFRETGIILEVSDYTSGGWGKEYRLMEKIGGKVKNVVIWEYPASGLWTGSDPQTVTDEGVGDSPLKLSETVSLVYTKYEKRTYANGLIEQYYYLADDYTTAQNAIRGVLGAGDEDGTVDAATPEARLKLVQGSAGKSGPHPYWYRIVNDPEVNDPYPFIYKGEAALLEAEAGSNWDSWQEGVNKRTMWFEEWN